MHRTSSRAWFPVSEPEGIALLVAPASKLGCSVGAVYGSGLGIGDGVHTVLGPNIEAVLSKPAEKEPSQD